MDPRLGQAMASKDRDAIQKVVKGIIESTFKEGTERYRFIDLNKEKYLVPFYAVRTGNLPLLKLYIEDFEDDINQVNYTRSTLLHHAILLQNSKMIDYLLAHGADVNKKNVLGNTPLIHSLTYGAPNGSIVQSLLNSGADIEITDDEGRTALMLAKGRHLDNIVRILEEHAKAAAARPTSPQKPQQHLPQKKQAPPQEHASTSKSKTPVAPPKEHVMTTGEYQVYLSLLLI